MRGRVVAVLALCGVVALDAQTARPKFEVASVKKHVGPGPASLRPDDAVSPVFTRINASVPVLIRFAFNLQSYQLVGGPEWLRTNLFDVDARAERPVSIEQRRLMVQS